jgi:cysteine-rich repeat protein
MSAWKMMLPAMMFAIVAACSSDPPKNNTGARLCIPGDNVFCRCEAPESVGTKRCSDDGQSFSECDCGEPIEDTGTLPEEDTFIPPEEDAGPNAEESCPGKTVAVDPAKEVVITGDTSAALDDAQGTGACAVAAGKEHVYAIIPTGTGSLSVKMTGAGTMDPTLYARGDSCLTGTQLRCGETTGAAGTEQFSINVIAGQKYYVFADGKAGTSGAYTLTLTLTTGSFCGDGKVIAGEGCDDANKIPGDGCENDCRPSGNTVESDSCPGVTGHVWPGSTLTIAGDTTAANLSYATATGVLCGTSSGIGGTAPDRVYALVAHKTGMMKVDIDANYNAIVYVRGAPCATGAQLACAAAVGASTVPQTETVSFGVTDGQTYYVVVDGAGSTDSVKYRGTFTLKATVM